MTIIKEMEHGYIGYVVALEQASAAVAKELNARAHQRVEEIFRHYKDTGADGVKLTELVLGSIVANLEELEAGLSLRILAIARQELPHFRQIKIPSLPHEIEIRNEAMRNHFDTIIENVRKQVKK